MALLAETWLALALLGTTIAAMRGKASAAAWSASLSLVLLLCLGTLPLGEALIKPLEREFPPRAAPAEIDGMAPPRSETVCSVPPGTAPHTRAVSRF